jgi:hypothetical protein
MRRIIVAALCLAFAAPAFAATAQQERMKACNAKAEGKTGDERKEFMSKCLKGEDDATSGMTPQQLRMKDCNAKATGLKGDERKQFMSDCLSSKTK